MNILYISNRIRYEVAYNEADSIPEAPRGEEGQGGLYAAQGSMQWKRGSAETRSSVTSRSRSLSRSFLILYRAFSLALTYLFLRAALHVHVLSLWRLFRFYIRVFSILLLLI